MESNYLIQRRLRKLGIIEPDKKPVANKIPTKSVKRKAEELLYKKQLKEMMEESSYCEIKVPGVCKTLATGLHHLQKRGVKNYRDRKNLVRACSECNLFIEENPTNPISLKFTISRFKK